MGGVKVRNLAGAADLGRRDRKKHETRAALERAALDLVAEHGLGGVTVEDISQAADVSSRTFFNYFSCKEEAIIGGPPVMAAEIADSMAAAPPGLPVVEVLRLALRAEAGRLQRRREWWLLKMRVFERNPSLLPHLLANGAEVERSVQAAVAARVGDGPGALGYPMLAAAVACTAFRCAVVRWAAETGDAGAPDLRDLLDEAFDALAAGLPDPSSE
ncbi:TetR family transcriptional regulator [Microtetraspora sp. NBRC 13810]|uniref:TetR/AcrR family transcriptional regulator n=1 Tax=Microtetraspora sp. NBRC 13810 TaxID=3030990 RepID=UPI0024A533E6|nr:TetR family transcriptional regulator [Microtetraspora sp. NBRC 13810]GLW09212.1 TetR family transcriptional regulator [Microtetraspora sp. NBRC 13810]